MLNKFFLKQTLVWTLAAVAPALADPPHTQIPIRHFADWSLDCRQAPCRIGTVVVGSDGSPVLEMGLTKGNPALLEIRTLLEIAVPDGLTLTIGADAPVVLPWQVCGPAGCVTRLAVTPDLVASLRRERQGAVVFTLADGSAVRIGVSLVGYVAARRARDGG